MKVTQIPMPYFAGNCFMLTGEDETKCALVDCGDAAWQVVEWLERRRVTPTHILLTHGHYDHIGAVNELRRHYGCLVCAAREEEDILLDPVKNLGDRWTDFLEPYIVPTDVPLKDGDVLEIRDLNIRVMATPGHTPGGVCYLCGGVMFAGDTLFEGSCGRTDFYGGSWAEMSASLRRLASLEGDWTVYCGHGAATTLEKERRTNPFILRALEEGKGL